MARIPTSQNPRPALCLALLLSLTVGGCYKIDIQQGNLLEQAEVERLRAGMSRRQVTDLLGTPILTDPFNAGRWDYVYYLFPSSDESEGERRRLSLFFEGDVLQRIETDGDAPSAP